MHPTKISSSEAQPKPMQSRAESSRTELDMTDIQQRGIALFALVLIAAILTKVLPIYFDDATAPVQSLILPPLAVLLCSYTLVRAAQGRWQSDRLIQFFIWLMLPTLFVGVSFAYGAPYAALLTIFPLAFLLVPRRLFKLYAVIGLVPMTLLAYQLLPTDLRYFGINTVLFTALTLALLRQLLDYPQRGSCSHARQVRQTSLAVAASIAVFALNGWLNNDGASVYAALLLGIAVLFAARGATLSREKLLHNSHQRLVLAIFAAIAAFEIVYEGMTSAALVAPLLVLGYLVVTVALARLLGLSLAVLLAVNLFYSIDLKHAANALRLLLGTGVIWFFVDQISQRLLHAQQDSTNEQRTNWRTIGMRAGQIFAASAVLVGMVAVPIVEKVNRDQLQPAIVGAQGDADQNIAQFSASLSNLASQVSLMANMDDLLNYATAPTPLSERALTSFLVSMADMRRQMVQLRYLDPTGKELVRINGGEEIIIVPPSQLQDKGSRPYFNSGMRLNPGELYFTRIELNRENGVVSQPPMPVLRVVAPVFDLIGNRKGVFVVNFDAQALLNDFGRYDPHSGEEEIYLLDKEGYALVAPPEQSLAAFSSGPRADNFARWQPELWTEVALAERDYQLTDETLDTFRAFNPLQHVILDLQQRGELPTDLSQELQQQIQALEMHAVQRLPLSALNSSNILLSPAGIFWILVTLILLAAFAVVLSYLIERQQRLSEQRSLLIKQGERLHQALIDAQAATAAKGRFLATMSHEIRTPLNGVIGMLGLAQDEIEDPKTKQRLTTIAQSADALKLIVDDILDISRLEEGRLEISTAPFAPTELLKSVQQLFAPAAQQKGLQFEVEATNPELYLLGDTHRLKQVLSNLVGNAVKFTQTGQIRLSSTLTLGAENRKIWQLMVEDSGIGMSEEQMSRLFQPFTQADDSITRRYGGSGLGLSICKQLVELMGGNISVSSEPAKGSRFCIELDVDTVEPPSEFQDEQKPLTPYERTKPIAGAKILLVDDSPTNRVVAKGILERMGMQVECAVDGGSALAALAKHTPDLVLLDIHMPDMDGFEVARQVRQGVCGAASQPVAIVALTAAAFESDREAARDAGMNGFLTKPLNADDLASALLRQLKPAVQGPMK